MAEKIDVDGLVGARADFRHLLARLIGRQHRTGQRTETAHFRHRRRQLEIDCASHRRQHDRMLNTEEVKNSAIRPHGVTFPARTASSYSTTRKLHIPNV